MFPNYTGQDLPLAPGVVLHSQVERFLLRHLQTLCHIDPKTPFDDSVALIEKIKGTLETEVQKIGAVTRQYRDECNALEPGNRASDAALEAELASFEELAIKPKIGTFWEKNPNFMERVKQHKPVKRKEEPARQNQANLPVPDQYKVGTVLPKMEQGNERGNQQISGGQRNGQALQQNGNLQQGQAVQQSQQQPRQPDQPAQQYTIHPTQRALHQSEQSVQRQAFQQNQKQPLQPDQPVQQYTIHATQREGHQSEQPVHLQAIQPNSRLPPQNDQSVQRQVVQPSQRTTLQANQSAQRHALPQSQRHLQHPQPGQSSQSTEPVVITLDSDAESPPLPYRQVVIPANLQPPNNNGMGMAKKKFPVKRAAPQPRMYGNGNKKPATAARNYPAIAQQQPSNSAPIRYRVVTNLPASSMSSGMYQSQENMMPQQMERQEQEHGQQQNVAVQQLVQVNRARARYPRGRQPVTMKPAPAAPPAPAPVQQEPVSLYYNDHEDNQDFDVDPEELAKAFFQ